MGVLIIPPIYISLLIFEYQNKELYFLKYVIPVVLLIFITIDVVVRKFPNSVEYIFFTYLVVLGIDLI